MLMRLYYLLIFAVVVLFVSPASAAGTPFSLSGQVLDRYGGPLQGACVTLIDNAHKTISINYTNENGNYDFVNVVSDTDTVSVRVNLTRGGKTYEIPSYYTRWYPSKGIQCINSNETSFSNYPEPVYGYIYGAIQAGAGNAASFIPGIVYLADPDSGIRYYQFADRTDGKASYTFYAPAGSYILYAQHRENGVVYESARKAVNVTPNAAVTEVLDTRIILPLTSPSSSPDPAEAPAHHENRVIGIVLTKDSQPLPGVTVALYQRSDNGSTFVPMVTDGRTVSATTNDQGRYAFSGVAPTTDDGKPIQAKKDIVAVAEYGAAEDRTEEKPLYYPDMLMANGGEDDARNVAFVPMVLDVGASATASATTSEPSGIPIEWAALLASLAVGILCLLGLYLFLSRKGR
ncbi:hypothetical protein MCP_2953 [Methanocella paludicola SANAE]|uniref:Carboxypeptidase regulatory-like domain-containing protein n=1 Tax=Methanocella paludicola (strain DSM 17711 / JCM 13418 / NBRC 101707 / SANAE) TaxID=304371 RepID=D1Z2V3_METPS|nr:carboxypeptidase-like regulatory domain-containing protein [Methanocella paludicola]BAI63025.1 hypothetical protein MCP_2953 [Methanocella paludicola SANAE]